MKRIGSTGAGGADDSRHDRRGQKKDESKSKLDQIKEAGVLVVGTSADYSPFEFHTQVDGQDTIVGIDISIASTSPISWAYS